MKIGYTLVEILITLAIVGTVAALTMPTLISEYNIKQWSVAADVFEKKLDESLREMNFQLVLAGHQTTESFVDELAKHFKTYKICNNDELAQCFSDKFYWTGSSSEAFDLDVIKTSRNFGQKNWKTNVVGVQFANGTNALIAYNPTDTCQQDQLSNNIDVSSCLAIIYDTSGSKLPNARGKDLRANSNVASLGVGCAFEVGSTCYEVAPFKPTPITKAECEELKSTLGIKNCNYDSDYWAGAVKACGGVNKLPTMAQLAAIANYVYGTTGVGAQTKKTGLTYLKDNLATLGLPTGKAFYLWSSSEVSKSNANTRHFNPTITDWSNDSRSDSSKRAVCLE